MKFINPQNFDEEIYQYVGNTNSQILHSLSGITFPDIRYNNVRKNSNMYSFEYVYEGEGFIQEDSTFFKVSAGDMFILHPNTYHHYYSNKKNPWKKIFFTIDGKIIFAKTLLKLYELENIILIQKINSPCTLEALYEAIKSECDNLDSKVEILFLELVQKIAKHIQTSPQNNTNINVNDPIVIAKRFIDDKISTKFKLSEVYSYVKLSASHFSREFKKTYGISPSDYIINKRIEISKDFLVTTSQGISTISALCNFYDTSHFVNTFHKVTGYTPQEYRIKFSDSNTSDLNTLTL